MPEIFDGATDQAGTVIYSDDLHPVRQAGLQGFELGLHPFDGLLGVLAKAHDHHATNYFSVSVQFGNAAAHLRPNADLGHILEQQWRPLTFTPSGMLSRSVTLWM